MAQSILTHAALYHIVPLLEQFASGLKKGGMLRVIRTFPELCAPLFTYTGGLDPNEVAQAVCVDE